MSKFLLFNENNDLIARFASDVNDVIPESAVKIAEELFWQTINETDGIWKIDSKGKIKKTAFPAPSNESVILNEILVLEASVTQRRIREAVLGIDNGWLADIDAQISELRNGLSG